MLLFQKLIDETQMSTIFQQNHWFFYPSKPFSFVHSNMIHPVLKKDQNTLVSRIEDPVRLFFPHYFPSLNVLFGTLKYMFDDLIHMYFSCNIKCGNIIHNLLKLTILIQCLVCEWWLLCDVWEQKKCIVNNRTSIHLSMRNSFKARTPDQTYTENTFIKCWRVFGE